MPLFLTILEGDTPEKAKPLIATRDAEIIRLVTAELARRLQPRNKPRTTVPTGDQPGEKTVGNAGSV